MCNSVRKLCERICTRNLSMDKYTRLVLTCLSHDPWCQPWRCYNLMPLPCSFHDSFTPFHFYRRSLPFNLITKCHHFHQFHYSSFFKQIIHNHMFVLIFKGQNWKRSVKLSKNQISHRYRPWSILDMKIVFILFFNKCCRNIWDGKNANYVSIKCNVK